ncbi:NUDIX hydrolase [Hyphomicrobium sp.]|uniref:NUDIX hydrolase n=1 Tax=Hyphomicrobium sp. TaxID=82 RepID=UPI0025BE0735|nr:NUDIX hydrolase [Hyphomicrobium sp.]MCC7251430.1 NUDIX hydrolase [Hyphomicrobium sp.]
MKDRDFTETTLSSRTVYRGRLLHVNEDEVRLPDGATGRREYIVHPGAAMMLAMPDEHTVLLERQYRHPLRRHVYELPAGKIDPGEDALQTARRELLEETGYTARDWRHLTTLYPVVAYSDERVELYLARGLEHVGHRLDEGEFLEVITLPLATAVDWARTGRIVEAKTILGLLLAEKIVAGQW